MLSDRVGRPSTGSRGLADVGWPSGLAIVALLVLVDVLLGRAVSVTGTLTVGPFLASALTSPRRTAGVGLVAVAGAIALSVYDAVSAGAACVRIGSVIAGSALAVWAAAHRRDREQRLIDMTRIADVAQHAILAPVPEIVGPFRLSSAYVSATREAAVGGDLLDVVAADQGVRLIVGDVRGKGLEAVRLSAMMLSSFRDKALTLPDLSRVAELLEVRLTPHLGPEDFITAVLAGIHWDGRLELLNCAHPPPLLFRDGTVRQLDPPAASTPFGLGPEPAPVVIQLNPGDRLLFYTDGLIEARSRSSREFVPLAGLTHTLGSDGFDVALDTVLARLRAAVGGQLDDDLALLLTEFQGPT
jgi:phosphoserine phosphatase RsbU/P